MYDNLVDLEMAIQHYEFEVDISSPRETMDSSLLVRSTSELGIPVAIRNQIHALAQNKGLQVEDSAHAENSVSSGKKEYMKIYA